MNSQILEIVALMRREIWEKRKLFAAVYLATSMAFLLAGWYWPKVYSSYSTILVDEHNILRPLMEGTAVTTNVVDRARLAREIIFSRHAMGEALTNAGWITADMSDLAREKTIADVEKRTKVENAGRNLIKVIYSDVDSERAFRTAKQITDAFIAHSIAAKQRESQDAYEFINSQVLDYHRKLQSAEQALKEFHSANIDARPGSQTQVNARIIDLRRRMEATQLELREVKIRKETLRKQLSGEAAIAENLTREGQYRERLASLEQQLSTLRLSYHDSYPDIVAIKTQIATLEAALKEGRKAAVDSVRAGETARAGEKAEPADRPVSQVATGSLLYQDLRSQFSATETQIASLNGRLEETIELLAREEERIVRINDVEAKLAELTRDYQVNQELYQSLLRQRENARISMKIDQENQGLTFKIQEPPALQLTPKGFRFAHFLAAGILFSFAFPTGVIYGLAFIDQKIRSPRVVSDKLSLPILASVYPMDTPKEYNPGTFAKSIILLVMVVCWLVYGYSAWLKVSGQS